jgi:hypothetical protein
MVDAVITANDVDMDRINRAVDGLVRDTGRSMFQSIMYAANMICQSGRADSKPARRYRDVVTNPLFQMNRKNRALMDLTGEEAIAARSKYMVEVYTPRHGRRMIYTNDPNDKIRNVPRRGTAKNIWDIMAAKFASAKTNIGAADKYMKIVGASSATAVNALLHNKLSYLEAAYPAQAARIVGKSMSRIEKAIERAIDKDVEVANRG